MQSNESDVQFLPLFSLQVVSVFKVFMRVLCSLGEYTLQVMFMYMFVIVTVLQESNANISCTLIRKCHDYEM